MNDVTTGILVLCVMLCGFSLMITHGKDPAYLLRPIGSKLWNVVAWLFRSLSGGLFALSGKSWKKAKAPNRHLVASLFFYFFCALFYTTGAVTAIPFGSGKKKK